jgi:cell division protein FtsB
VTGFGALRVPRAAHPGGMARNMAQRRETARYRGKLLLSGFLLTALLAGAIQLGNAVTGLRRDVQDLARTNRNLEARRAQLAVQWNTESSRQVILRRAAKELGLVVDEAPAVILVTRRDIAGPQVAWTRWLQRLGPVDLTAATLMPSDTP